MPVSNELRDLRTIAKSKAFLWTQSSVCKVLEYLASRGWYPTDATAAKGTITQHTYGAPYRARENRNNIDDARFKDPTCSQSCGAQKALKRALMMQRNKSPLKAMVANASKALAVRDIEKVQDLLDEITKAVGG
jgi:hypothetical protein